MNIQYAEHLEHVAGCASENNNCLSEARDRCVDLGYTDGEKIQSALSCGLFVVAVDEIYYCRATDAIAGSYEAFRGSYATRELAEAAAGEIADRSEGEDLAYVLPRLPRPVPACVASAVEDDGVPF